MERKEYLNIRFKRDFLQYSLLQEDTLSAKEIAGNLYRVVSLTTLINEGKKQIDTLLDKHLSLDALKVEGKLSNTLPEALSLGVQDRIIEEFRNSPLLDEAQELNAGTLNALVHAIEKQTWSNGISEMAEAIHLLVDKLSETARNYEQMQSPVDMQLLTDRYQAAQENTFIERLQSSNIDDVIAYRAALVDYVATECENHLYKTVHKALVALRDNSTFDRLQHHFAQLHEYALQLKSSLPVVEPNPEWESEYNRLVPTDFYRRNVEGITAEQAFHMHLFQFFAQHEAWMVEQGMLLDGELRVYTPGNPQAIDILLEMMEL